MVVTWGLHKNTSIINKINQNCSEMQSHPCENGYCKTYQKICQCSNINLAIMGNNMKTPQETKISWMWRYRTVCDPNTGRQRYGFRIPAQPEWNRSKGTFSHQPDISKAKGWTDSSVVGQISMRKNQPQKHQQKPNDLSPTKATNPPKQNAKQKSKTDI